MAVSSTATPDAAATPAPVPAQRIKSVDALRGFDMFWISGGQQVVLAFLALLVNPLPEWLQYHFEHVDWQGFSAWDLIMPLFLFVTGVSMPFSIKKRAETGGYGAAYKKIVRRVLILWLFGMIVQGDLIESLYEMNLWHIQLYSNTLQSIAAGYLVASVLMLHFGKAVQLAAIPVLLWTYCLVVMFVPVPGHPAFLLDPHTNICMYIDGMVLGPFRETSPHYAYTWVFSSLGFAASVLLGVQAGYILSANARPWAKFQALAGAGIACLALGWMWGAWFPIIKHIWTSSMVLWAAGWSFLLLAAFYAVVDIAGWQKWAFPFVVIGTNAIAIYMGWHIFEATPVPGMFMGLMAHAGSIGAFLGHGILFALGWVILFAMYRKKIFLRI